MNRIDQWFDSKGWTPFEFQRAAWAAYRAGRDGLVHAPTGMGKSYAAFGGPVLDWIDGHVGWAPPTNRRDTPSKKMVGHAHPAVVWITPLRALAHDTTKNLIEMVDGLKLPWSVELRTGDTAASIKKRQRTRLPTVLVTTPESLTVLMSYPDAGEKFATLRCIVVDEWHELMGTKRGVQTELALARLRTWSQGIRTWGMSATMGNLEEAMQVLVGRPSPSGVLAAPGRGWRGDGVVLATGAIEPGEGTHEGERAIERGKGVEVDALVDSLAPETSQAPSPRPSPGRSEYLAGRGGGAPVLITAPEKKKIEIVTLIPPDIQRFPWAGHMGLSLLPEVVAAIERASSTLLFINTRSQAEAWFRALIEARPDWMTIPGGVALHHGSLDRDLREKVETLLREGKLRCVVCTSSMELGVDFTPVDQVFQVGSPKGIGRLLQRAGRSGHRPGAVSRIVGVPTHAFELVEFAGVRAAAFAKDAAGNSAPRIEARIPIEMSLDVLVQHIVTVAAGGGFDERELLSEVRTTHAFADLTDQQWGWCMDFVMRGGPSLRAYPQYARVVRSPDGRFTISNHTIERYHRLMIGTITSNVAVKVQMQGGPMLGTVEEGFISRMNPGDQFFFAGRHLELVRVRQLTAYVKRAVQPKGAVPRWDGGRFPLSTQLAEAVRTKLDEARRGLAADPEMQAVMPILELQERTSRLPRPGELLIERTFTRDGDHLLVFPFEGRSVHEGLASLLAYRITAGEPRTLTVTANDYGFELLSPTSMMINESEFRRLLSTERLVEDLLACLNHTQMARRQFRDIARIAGLIFPGYPGSGKTARQLQATSELFYDVFVQFDTDNLLLDQARREVLEQQLEVQRLLTTLRRMSEMAIAIVDTPRLSPLAFPLWADRLRTQHMSSEAWSQRVQRMALELEHEADEQQAADAATGRAPQRRRANGKTRSRTNDGNTERTPDDARHAGRRNTRATR